MKINTLKLPENRLLYLNLCLSIGFALTLLVVRMQLTESRFYLFLVWNLFLAGIPFVISQLLKTSAAMRSRRILRFLAFGTWLLFLPNSPYIITDLVHLHNDRSNLVWVDLFLVFVFACNGLLLGLLSLLDMFTLISKRYGNRAARYALFNICLLCGYGIYLGRFLRFNSWDITTRPLTLFHQIMNSLSEPNVWAFSFAFGGFLWVVFSVLQSVLGRRKTTRIKEKV